MLKSNDPSHLNTDCHGIGGKQDVVSSFSYSTACPELECTQNAEPAKCYEPVTTG